MLNNIDWLFLRKALIIFFVVLVLSGALIFLGYSYENSKQADYNQGKNALNATHSRYQKLVEDLDLLHQYTKSYEEYKNTGLLGSERRLSWIETLEAVNGNIGLPLMTYSLLPQESYKMAKLKVSNEVKVNSTPMNLQMDILHEEDLFTVFENINENIANLFTIDTCSLSRIGGAQLNTRAANLRTKCLLRWITVDVKKS